MHAIARQESSFHAKIAAYDGGLGFMQLMPKHIISTAKKINIVLDMNKIKDMNYNIQLGSFYLQDHVEKFKSCLLAIYSYNCGRKRLLQYTKIFGDFHLVNDDMKILSAMEKFPVNISREYGKRVWSNYMIYLILTQGKIDFSNMKLNQIVPF